MFQFKEEFVVILWDYGRHCDEFEVDRVLGPMTWEEAEQTRDLEDSLHHVTIASLFRPQGELL